MIKLFIIFLSFIFLSSCTLLKLYQPNKKNKPYNYDSKQAVKKKSTILNFDKKTNIIKNNNIDEDSISNDNKSMLEEIVVLDAEGVSLLSLLERILPGWKIKIPKTLELIKIDAVIQTTRRQAINDILSQIQVQGSFYEKITPNPILVIYED